MFFKRKQKEGRETPQTDRLHTFTEPPNPHWIHKLNLFIKLCYVSPGLIWPWSLPFQSVWKSPFTTTGKLHFHLFFLSLSLFLTPSIVCFYVTGVWHLWLLVWSHCKCLKYNVSALKSFHSLPREKQNSHLKFTCGMCLESIVVATPPQFDGPEQITSHSPFPINLPITSGYV